MLHVGSAGQRNQRLMVHALLDLSPLRLLRRPYARRDSAVKLAHALTPNYPAAEYPEEIADDQSSRSTRVL